MVLKAEYLQLRHRRAILKPEKEQGGTFMGYMGNEIGILLDELEAFMGMGLFSLILTELPSSLISIAVYVLTGLGMYTIAKRRGIHKPWLAWVPIANLWLLGCIADQYRSVARGEVKNRRKVLLGTRIAMVVLSILVLVLCITMLFSILSVGLRNLENMDEIAAAELVSSMLVPMAGMILLCLPLMVLAIVHTVFYYIALYDLFSSCDPSNATLYLVLSIFIQFTLPIFLMICRNRDDGMPARQQPVFQPPVEPWQENM